MARNSRWKESKNKRDGGAFLSVPMSVLNSQAYCLAGPYARMLLFDLFAQYRGDNNGDMCAAWKLMKPRGWRSEETLGKAKRELIELGLIVETRKGARPNKASLYAVTWCDLDDCRGKLDISPAAFPRGRYRLRDTLPPILGKNASLNTPAVAARGAIAPSAVVESLSTTTPADAIRH
jgi:hypothetical protein